MALYFECLINKNEKYNIHTVRIEREFCTFVESFYHSADVFLELLCVGTHFKCRQDI